MQPMEIPQLQKNIMLPIGNAAIAPLLLPQQLYRKNVRSAAKNATLKTLPVIRLIVVGLGILTPGCDEEQTGGYNNRKGK